MRTKHQTNALDTPAWLRTGQVRWTWHAWEPLMFFTRLAWQNPIGHSNAHWMKDWFLHMHSEEYVRTLAEAGFNCISTHFHKGFGLEAEAEEMEMTRQLIELCHRYGIRVIVYTQSMSIMPETMFAELPEAESWLQVDAQGRPITYGEQTWRLYPCPSHDGYVDYVKRVVERAITWAGADGLHLDNTGFMACQCAACREKFSAYLREKYSNGYQARFGIPTLDHVQVAAAGATYDPVYQESIRYRCGRLTWFIEEIRRYARSLNPDVAVAANVTVGSPMNFYEVYGVDYSTAPRASDMVYAENGDFPTIEDDILITQIRYYKLGQATGAVVIPTNWLLDKEASQAKVRLPETPGEIKLDLAESAAYGRQLVGATWAGRLVDRGARSLIERPEVFETVRTYFDFFKAHEELYSGSKSLANVATYRNFPSLAFHYDKVYASIVGYEQCLIQHQVPFEILFPEDLDRLDEFDVLIVPHILCMSDDECARIRAFVEGGKGLIATGETSLYDEDSRQRRDYGFADLFGVTYLDSCEAGDVHRNGRVLFAPAAPERVDCNRFNYQTRAPLPPDHEALVGYVREVSPSELPLEVDATPYVTTEICEKDGRLVIHLINHRVDEPVRDVTIRLAGRLSAGSTAEILSVDDGSCTKVAVARDSTGHAVIEIPELQVYSVVVCG